MAPNHHAKWVVCFPTERQKVKIKLKKGRDNWKMEKAR